MTKSPRQRIQTLLRIHGGRCFIVASCDGFKLFAQEAQKMESEGLVTTTRKFTATPAAGENSGMEINST